MSNKKKKNAVQIDRDVEIQGAKMFGKHVSKEKGKLLLLMTVLACAAPILLGLRLWDAIPELYETGLIGTNGEDDSLPRWAIVFVIPGLMCLLDLICHLQLGRYQKRMTIPPAKFRLIGRWGFPVISVLFAGGLIREAAGLKPLAMTYLTPCILGLVMMILGGQMYECKEGALVSLKFSFLQNDPILRKDVHRFAAWAWLVVGLCAIVLAQVSDLSGMIACGVMLLALLAPWVYGRSKAVSRL